MSDDSVQAVVAAVRQGALPTGAAGAVGASGKRRSRSKSLTPGASTVDKPSASAPAAPLASAQHGCKEGGSSPSEHANPAAKLRAAALKS